MISYWRTVRANSANRNCVLFSICVLILACTAQQSHAQDRISSLRQDAVRSAVVHVRDSMVQIETIGGADSGSDGAASGPSTGVIVSADGLILTSGYNLRGNPASIFVRIKDQPRVLARIVIRDTGRNLAVLKIDADSPLEPVGFSNLEQLQPGQTAIAAGKIYDPVEANFSVGIISACSRIQGRAIQTDAAVSATNYGGPLITLEGQVVGILTPLSATSTDSEAGAEWYDSGIGFAANPRELMNAIADGTATETMRPGIAGLAFDSKDEYAGKPLVKVSYADSPARVAGILPGDLVTKVNGTPIDRIIQFRNLVGPLYEGQTAELAIQRDGDSFTAQLQLAGELPPFRIPAIGMCVEATDDDTSLIRHVFENSPAMKAGLKPGDLITGVPGFDPPTPDKLETAIMDASVGGELKLSIDRDGEAIEFNLQPVDRTAEIVADPPAAYARGEAIVSEIKVADASNSCTLVRPPESGKTPSLMVWLPPPGNQDQETVSEPWLKSCSRRNVAVLIVQAESDQRWDPGESAVITKAIDVLAGSLDFDPRRVCIGGRGAGGSMAARTLTSNRRKFSGLTMIDARAPASLLALQSSAVAPVLIYIGIKQSFEHTVSTTAAVERLRSAQLPVHLEQNESGNRTDLAEKLLLWVDILNRL